MYGGAPSTLSWKNNFYAEINHVETDREGIEPDDFDKIIKFVAK